MADVPVEDRTVLLFDNGPGYLSRQFNDYLRVGGIRHIVASPHHPQTNWRIERYYRTIKGELSLVPYEMPSALKEAIQAFIVIPPTPALRNGQAKVFLKGKEFEGGPSLAIDRSVRVSGQYVGTYRGLLRDTRYGVTSREHQTIRFSGGSCRVGQDDVRVDHLRWRCWRRLYVFDQRRKIISTRLWFLRIPLWKKEVPFSQIAYLGVHAEVDYHGVFGGFPKLRVVVALAGQKGLLEVAKLFYGRRIGRLCSPEEAHERAQTIEEALREVTGLLRSQGR